MKSKEEERKGRWGEGWKMMSKNVSFPGKEKSGPQRVTTKLSAFKCMHFLSLSSFPLLFIFFFTFTLFPSSFHQNYSWWRSWMDCVTRRVNGSCFDLADRKKFLGERESVFSQSKESKKERRWWKRERNETGMCGDDGLNVISKKGMKILDWMSKNYKMRRNVFDWEKRTHEKTVLSKKEVSLSSIFFSLSLSSIFFSLLLAFICFFMGTSTSVQQQFSTLQQC